MIKLELEDFIYEIKEEMECYAEIGKELERAFTEYCEEVRAGKFPIDGTHTYKISDEERAKIEAMI